MDAPGSATRYQSYAEAADQVERATAQELRAMLARMQRRAPTDEAELVFAARQAVMREFEDRSVSPRTWVGVGETLYDRDPRALAAVEAVLAKVEAWTCGYEPTGRNGRVDGEAAEHRQNMTWSARAVAQFAADLPDAAALWSVARALEAQVDPFWTPGAEDVAWGLQDALAAAGVPDDGRDDLRFVSPRVGFMPKTEFLEYLRDEGSLLKAVRAAGVEHHRRFGEACGRFDAEKARAFYRASGPWKTALYFDAEARARVARLRGAAEPAEQPRPPVPTVEQNPVTKGSAQAKEAFYRQELKDDYSPFGYWFAPDGRRFPMQSPECHVTWIQDKLGFARDAAGRRADDVAYDQGWVAMTMWDLYRSDACIAFRDGAPNARALKAAAAVVRRGGDFPGVTIESYDADHNVIASERCFDEGRPKAGFLRGAQRLAELAALAPEPSAELPEAEPPSATFG